MVWKKDLTAISKGGSIEKHAHKGFKSQSVGRNEFATVAGGKPAHRANNDYGKRPPAAAPKLSPTPNPDDADAGYDSTASHLASDDGMPVNDHDEDDA